MKSSFGEMYQAGQLLSLQGLNGETITQAFVLNYDPTHDKWRPSGLSKSASDFPSPNHWHVAVKSPNSDEWLPAAVWEDSDYNQGRFGAHFTREQKRTESQGRPLAYSSDEMGRRIYEIARYVAEVVSIKASVE